LSLTLHFRVKIIGLQLKIGYRQIKVKKFGSQTIY